MKTIKDILSNFGYITKPQLAELAEHFPHTKVVIKWGGMERERLPAWEAPQRIKSIEDQDIDYCRSVFWWSRDLDKLRDVLGVAK